MMRLEHLSILLTVFQLVKLLLNSVVYTITIPLTTEFFLMLYFEIILGSQILCE